jgi:polyisoprenoid-binding protein YceI
VETTIRQDRVRSSEADTHPPTGKWGYDLSHSKLGFTISHFGISETEGRFTKFDGHVYSDKPDFSDAVIELIIEAASINTEDGPRDNHLRSADFFDVAQFPSIVFKSRAIAFAGEYRYQLTGDIQMHGVTREITLYVVYRGTVDDPFNNTKAGFLINGAIDRTQFGLTWNGVLAAGGLLVGNTVNFSINIELVKIKPSAE